MGVATDKVQAGRSTAYAQPECVAEVREHFESLLERPGMKDAAEVGLRVLGEWADKLFFLIPTNVPASHTLRRTMLVVQMLVEYAAAWRAPPALFPLNAAPNLTW